MELRQLCKKCSHELPANAVVCENCHSLVHADELSRLSEEARAIETSGDLSQARDKWLRLLLLMPGDSKQAEWVHDHARELDLKVKAAASAQQRQKWAQKFGPLAPILILLTKVKSLAVLLKFNFLLNLAAFMGVYWALYGIRFGIGFALLILIHEMGHFIDVKRRGLRAELPVFLPGLGAYVRWQALGVSVETRAGVSLAGPAAGLLAAIGCAAMWWTTGSPLWSALARAGAWLNILNLIPVWVLDGGQAVLALSKAERFVLLSVSLLLWLTLGENVMLLVAIGAGWRLFTKDCSPKLSIATTAYFLTVLTSLGVIMWLMPGQGFGR